MRNKWTVILLDKIVRGPVTGIHCTTTCRLWKMRVTPQADSSRLKQAAGKGHLWPNISIILSQYETPAFIDPVCPSHMWCHPQQARFLERKHSHHVTPCHTPCWEALVEPLLSNLERFQKEHHCFHSKITHFPWFPLKCLGKSPISTIPPVSPRSPRGQRRLTEAIATLHVRRSRQQRLNDVQMSIPRRDDHWMVTICGKPWGTTLWL